MSEEITFIVFQSCDLSPGGNVLRTCRALAGVKIGAPEGVLGPDGKSL